MGLVRIGDVMVNVAVLRPSVAAPGRPIAVCVHGLGRDSLASFYQTLGTPLTRHGFTVVLYDLRGHGGSSRPATGYRLDDFSDELAGVISYVAKHENATGPLHLVGNSYGGAIVMHYAHRWPERVACLAVIEAGPPTNLWSWSIRVAVDRFLREVQRPEVLKAVERRFGSVAHDQTVRAVRASAATTFAAEVHTGTLLDEAQVRAYPHPVLALFGGDSPAAAAAPALAAAMPHCRTEVLPNQGHTVLVDAPDKICGLILPWLLERAALTAQNTRDGGE